MSKSHQRKTGPDAPHYEASGVVARVSKEPHKVLLMASQYPGGPEHVVVQGSNSVALFFDAEAALDYVEWKNQKP